jgi:beta-N-acetylhexosaminidase
MSAHVIYEKVDNEIATFSKLWLQEVLRKQMEFKGMIFSDDLSMKAAECDENYMSRVQKALQAGCDMVLICNSSENACLVAEQMESYNNPASQMRLARMHGSKNSLSHQDLRNSKKWKQAVVEVESYQASPYGELTL